MNPKVYIETTIISYLAARAGRIVEAYHEATFASERVILETGNPRPLPAAEILAGVKSRKPRDRRLSGGIPQTCNAPQRGGSGAARSLPNQAYNTKSR